MVNEYKLYRCKFIKENKNFIVGRDIFNSKLYFIKKGTATKMFKVGIDSSFYAKKTIRGFIFKKRILDAIEYEQFINFSKQY